MEEEQQQEQEKQPTTTTTTTTGSNPHSDHAFALKMLVDSRNAGAVLGMHFAFVFLYILYVMMKVFFWE